MGSLEVATYDPRRPVGAGAPLGSRRGQRASESIRREVTVPLLAALGSLALHAVFVVPLVWGDVGKTPRTPIPRILGQSARESADSSAMQWVALEPERNDAGDNEPAPALPPPSLRTVTLSEAFDPARPEIPDPDATSREARASAPMVERYLGQIDARIERAWLKPRSAIRGGEAFSCRARILQDATGSVLQVRLERCNGTLAWQVSLTHAILTASPLPAPPGPGVFARVIRLDFKSEAYTPGVPSEQYEPESAVATAQQAGDDGASRAVGKFEAASRAARAGNRNIDLRIEGTSSRTRAGQPESSSEAPADTLQEQPSHN